MYPEWLTLLGGQVCPRCLIADLKVIYVHLLLGKIVGNYVSNVEIRLISNDLLWS